RGGGSVVPAPPLRAHEAVDRGRRRTVRLGGWWGRRLPGWWGTRPGPAPHEPVAEDTAGRGEKQRVDHGQVLLWGGANEVVSGPGPVACGARTAGRTLGPRCDRRYGP